MTRLSKSNLVTEWNCYFDSLAKAFAKCTKTSFHNILSQLMYIGYAVANNMRINFAQLIWIPMARRLIAAKKDLALGNNISCYYPRFLTLILNHIFHHKTKPSLTTGPLKSPRPHIRNFTPGYTLAANSLGSWLSLPRTCPTT